MPTLEPQLPLNAADSALLWMAEEWNTNKAPEVGVDTLAQHRRLAMKLDAAIFANADDWTANLAVQPQQQTEAS